MDLNISRDEVLELAAEKLADSVRADPDEVRGMIEARINEVVANLVTDETRASIAETIDKALADETEKVLRQQVIPLDIWGEAQGEPTTIREQLHKRALQYWEESVEPDRHNTGRYKVTSYGGKPRHRVVFTDIAQEAFESAMRSNINEMVKAFRDALRTDATALIGKHIDNIISNRVVGP